MANDRIAELASTLLTLKGRLHRAGDSDPWLLAWQLMAGATYSLAKARALLPGKADDLSTETANVLASIKASASLDEAGSPTWQLGYLLNSAEIRIQSAVHRVLRAYAAQRGDAFPLANKILGGFPNCRGSLPIGPTAKRVLVGFTASQRPMPPTPGAALRNVWNRANALKHDPEHDPSERLKFECRWNEAVVAVEETLDVFQGLGLHRGTIKPA